MPVWPWEPLLQGLTSLSESQVKGLLKIQSTLTISVRTQGTQACIHIGEYILFPIEDDITSNISKWKLWQLKEEKLRLPRGDIEKGVAKSVHKYYVSLPSAEAHHTTHPTGGIYGVAQKIHFKLVEKIHQLVKELQK